MALVLAIDQGTSATKAIVVDESGSIRANVEVPVRVMTDAQGGVEIDPHELLASVLQAGRTALSQCGNPKIDAVGLANQGETVVAWSRTSGEPQHNAIVWQDRRSVGICRDIGERAHEVESITGMQVDPYFVAPKISWLQPRLQNCASNTVITTSDVWLLHKLCGSFSTDVSTASRTLLTNLETLEWNPTCVDVFGIEQRFLPEIHDNDAIIGSSNTFGGDVAVVGTCVDQQAALFAENCHSAGEMKCTYGTGAFLLANSGPQPHRSTSGLTACAAWRIDGQTNWCLDGQVYTAGAAISWLIEMGILGSAQEIDPLCSAMSITNPITFVPALAGLAAPWWKPTATGRVVGLSLSTTRAQLVHATLMGIAAQVAIVVRAAANDLGHHAQLLRVDGGLTQSAVLLQLQADLTQCAVQPYPSPHATALGIAEMSLRGIGATSPGFHLSSTLPHRDIVEPQISRDQADSILARWSLIADQSVDEANS